MSNKVKNKSLNEIKNEWDAISEKRQEIIELGKDISLTCVTSPCILNEIEKEKPSIVLDVGCGTGYLTSKLSELCDFCYGVDISEKSIKKAKEKYSSPKINFINSSISNTNIDAQVDICVSNMVIMTDPEWKESLKHIYELLKFDGYFMLMLTHPCFWPSYWKYDTEPWFNYNQEIYVQHHFFTSFSESLGVSTHIHRPLSSYIKTILETGFDIVTIKEPQPIECTPPGYHYDYPRFLFIKCKKTQKSQTNNS